VFAARPHRRDADRPTLRRIDDLHVSSVALAGCLAITDLVLHRQNRVQRLHPLYRPRLEDVLAAKDLVTLRVHEGTAVLSLLKATRISLHVARGMRSRVV
jgi:hypothetical protein